MVPRRDSNPQPMHHKSYAPIAPPCHMAGIAIYIYWRWFVHKVLMHSAYQKFYSNWHCRYTFYLFYFTHVSVVVFDIVNYSVTWLDTPTPSLAAESDSASGPSPRVLSARQRKVSHGCSEGNTPKTPKSAAAAGGGKVSDDRVFFPSNFSVERLGDLATMSRPTVG